MNSLYLSTNRFLLFACILSLLAFTGCGDDDGDAPVDPIVEPELLSSDINEELRLENTVAEDGLADYIVDGFLQVNADLIIDPGVCIVFTANSGLFINTDGSIQAIGTSNEPIKFTGEMKEEGFWRGLQIRANDVRNELNHVILEYAGSDYLATYGTNVKLNGGVAIEGASGSYGSLKLHNSTIQKCMGIGFIVEQHASLREFSNNILADNTEAAVRIDADNTGSIDSETSFTGNGFNGVEINASGSPTHDLTAEDTWQPLSDGAAYRIAQSFDARATLTIMPGTIIEFEANQTIAFKQDFSGPNDGIIIAKGTASEPITFTGATKTAGYWQGLIVQSNSVLNELDHCIVEYGGSDEIDGGMANIILSKDGAFEDPDLSVSNTTLRHSAGCAIYVDPFGGNITTSDITVSDNAGGGICP
ncbi:hypothetical protein GCM10009122_57010 [Fulvivirga kasyanovii]|uniref:Right handed beta helix domain-containing protein n=1 Tax=Fulvivirga kasyanovii TaxID=396812 RepID=A0ABW9RPA8_9BACT|nr:hypothetical protein [Fulvivirga kasyanovii]MTI24950.1 hypothetical protein [Fulvivirga kasyanovii]